jgi:signal transduction histidine kinase
VVERDGAAEAEKQGWTAVADGIEARHADIVGRWLDRMAAHTVNAGRPIETAELRASIGDYLDHLADALRSGARIDWGVVDDWKGIARAHAAGRVRLGFAIDEVVLELVALRESMLDSFRAAGMPLSAEQVARLCGLVDLALAAAAAGFVEARDQEARRQKAQQIGFITHELRNPLTTAKIAATQLRRQPPPGATAAAPNRRVLDALDRSLERMRQMIDDVLLSERLDNGAIPSRPVDVQLGHIMDEALRAATHDSHEKGLHLQTRFDPDLLLYADPDLAVSALQNVVDNAVKFTDRGNVQVDVEDRGSEIAVHVHDSCNGMTPEELRTIFEPFHRGRSGKPGTGLGLAIARRAVEAQGGTITAESSDDTGCRFCVTLPKSRH